MKENILKKQPYTIYKIGDNVKLLKHPYKGIEKRIKYPIVDITHSGVAMVEVPINKQKAIYPFYDNELTPTK